MLCRRDTFFWLRGWVLLCILYTFENLLCAGTPFFKNISVLGLPCYALDVTTIAGFNLADSNCDSLWLSTTFDGKHMVISGLKNGFCAINFNNSPGASAPIINFYGVGNTTEVFTEPSFASGFIPPGQSTISNYSDYVYDSTNSYWRVTDSNDSTPAVLRYFLRNINGKRFRQVGPNSMSILAAISLSGYLEFYKSQVKMTDGWAPLQSKVSCFSIVANGDIDVSPYQAVLVRNDGASTDGLWFYSDLRKQFALGYNGGEAVKLSNQIFTSVEMCIVNGMPCVVAVDGKGGLYACKNPALGGLYKIDLTDYSTSVKNQWVAGRGVGLDNNGYVYLTLRNANNSADNGLLCITAIDGLLAISGNTLELNPIWRYSATGNPIKTDDVVQITLDGKFLTLNPNAAQTGNNDILLTNAPDKINSNFKLLVNTANNLIALQAANGRWVAPNPNAFDPYHLQAWLNYVPNPNDSIASLDKTSALAPALFCFNQIGFNSYLRSVFSAGPNLASSGALLPNVGGFIKARTDQLLAGNDAQALFSPFSKMNITQNLAAVALADNFSLAQTFLTNLSTLQGNADVCSNILLAIAMAVWDKQNWGNGSIAWTNKFVSSIFDNSTAQGKGNLYALPVDDVSLAEAKNALNDLININFKSSTSISCQPYTIPRVDFANNSLSLVAVFRSNKSQNAFYVDVKGNLFSESSSGSGSKLNPTGSITIPDLTVGRLKCTPYAFPLMDNNKNSLSLVAMFTQDDVPTVYYVDNNGRLYSGTNATGVSALAPVTARDIISIPGLTAASDGSGIIEASIPDLSSLAMAKLLFALPNGVQAPADQLLNPKFDWTASWKVLVYRKMVDILRARFADTSVAENVAFLNQLEAWNAKMLAAIPVLQDTTVEAPFRAMIYAWDASKTDATKLVGLKARINALVQNTGFLAQTYSYDTYQNLKWFNVSSGTSTTGQQLLSSWLQGQGLVLITRTKNSVDADRIIQADIDGWNQTLTSKLAITAAVDGQEALLPGNIDALVALASKDASLSLDDLNKLRQINSFLVANTNTMLQSEIDKVNLSFAALKDNNASQLAAANPAIVLSSLVPLQLLSDWKSLQVTLVNLTSILGPAIPMAAGLASDIYEVEAQIYAKIIGIDLAKDFSFPYLFTGAGRDTDLVVNVALGLSKAPLRVKLYLIQQILLKLSNVDPANPGLWERKVASNTKWKEYLATLMRETVAKIGADYGTNADILTAVNALQAKFATVPYFTDVSWSAQLEALINGLAGLNQANLQAFVNLFESLVITRMDLTLGGLDDELDAWQTLLNVSIPGNVLTGVSSSVVGQVTGLDSLKLIALAQKSFTTKDLVQRFADLSKEPLWYNYYGVIGEKIYRALQNRMIQLSPLDCQVIEAARLSFLNQAPSLSWLGGRSTNQFIYNLPSGVADSFIKFLNDRTAEFNVAVTNGIWDVSKEKQGFWDIDKQDAKIISFSFYWDLILRYAEWNPSWSNPAHKYGFKALLNRIVLSANNLANKLAQTQGVSNQQSQMYQSIATAASALISTLSASSSSSVPNNVNNVNGTVATGATIAGVVTK